MAVGIKSLRIGSHVSFGGERVKVIGIGSSGLIEFKNTDGDLFRVLANDVESIAITAELLEELGFELRKGSDSWLRYENLSEDGCDWGIIASEYGFDGWWQIMFRPRDSRLRNEGCYKYLHQLESILALHGVELIKE